MSEVQQNSDEIKTISGRVSDLEKIKQKAMKKSMKSSALKKKAKCITVKITKLSISQKGTVNEERYPRVQIEQSQTADHRLFKIKGPSVAVDAAIAKMDAKYQPHLSIVWMWAKRDECIYIDMILPCEIFREMLSSSVWAKQSSMCRPTSPLSHHSHSFNRCITNTASWRYENYKLLIRTHWYFRAITNGGAKIRRREDD